MTNARGGNAVVAFARRADGHLRRVGSFPTGGTGSGSFEDTAHGLVLGTSQGEASPNNLIEDAELLFATNARSDSIAVFRVEKDEIVEVDVQPSGGEKPVSVTVNRGVLYVLNSGEATDDLFDSEMHVIPNCTTGTPSITGFTVGTNGELDPIAGSTRRLSELGGSGCAQVSFNPAGNVLVVTERLAKDEGPPGFMGDEGVISTYTRNADGTLSTGPVVTEATGSGRSASPSTRPATSSRRSSSTASWVPDSGLQHGTESVAAARSRLRAPRSATAGPTPAGS